MSLDGRAVLDLHSHTSASFDSLSDPIAHARAAASRGVTHLAITDHDRVDGALRARDAHAMAHVRGGVAAGDEADVVAVRLARRDKPAPLGLVAHLGLRIGTKREERVRDLLAGQHAQHVGLVLVRIRPAVQLGPAGPLLDARVVACRDGVESQRSGPVHHSGKFDALVAADAGIGGATGPILVEEVVDDLALEAVGQVPHVERDAQQISDAPGIARIVDGAAAPRTRPVDGRGLGQRQMHSDDLVTLVDKAGGCHRRVHAARHGGDDAHQRT